MDFLTQEEKQKIFDEFFAGKIKEIADVKYKIHTNLPFFDEEYMGNNQYHVKSNREVDDYQISTLQSRNIKILRISPRQQDNQGALLTLTMEYVPPTETKKKTRSKRN